MSDNVTFEYGATSYQCEFNPKYIYIYPERVQVTDELASGDTKLYKKGFKIHFDLEWTAKHLFRKDQMTALVAMYAATEGITITPYPDSLPSASFNVAWNEPKMNFTQVEGVSNIGYQGKMHLEGLVTTTLSSAWIAGEL